MKIHNLNDFIDESENQERDYCQETIDYTDYIIKCMERNQNYSSTDNDDIVLPNFITHAFEKGYIKQIEDMWIKPGDRFYYKSKYSGFHTLVCNSIYYFEKDFFIDVKVGNKFISYNIEECYDIDKKSLSDKEIELNI